MDGKIQAAIDTNATALAYYGYTERGLNPIWIATTRWRRSAVVEGITYRFVTLTAWRAGPDSPTCRATVISP